MDDTSDPRLPEVTIEPADNGHVVRWHQRSSKKDQSGRSVRRVASTVDEALAHAKSALGGGSIKSSKKKSYRDGQSGSGSTTAEGESGSSASPAAHAMHHSSARRPSRRRARIGGRR